MIINTACPRNCYSTCSFKVKLEKGRIVNILPQPENKATPEGPCLKGLSYIERTYSGKRLKTPLLKQNDTFKPISWEEVYSILAEKLISVKEKYGSQAVFFYESSGMSGLLNGFSTAFWEMYGGVTIKYGNMCWPAGLEATRLTLGENKHNAPWDLENSKLIILWGKNSAETNVQEIIHIDKAIKKGAKLIVIDPRQTETSEKALLHLAVRPGSDAVLAMAIANYLIASNKFNKTFVENYVLGFEAYAEKVKEFSIETASVICQIPKKLILEMAEMIAQTKPMSIVSGYGLQRFSNGGQTIRTILALQIITGNLGKKGASWRYANLQSYVFDSVKEPLSYFPENKPSGKFRKSVSVFRLGEDILAQQNPPIKFLWVERANPLTQNPDTNKINKAFAEIEFKVVVEQFMTDTALAADLILPAKNLFEVSDIIGSYWNPYVQLMQKVKEPEGEAKTELQIYYELAKKMNFAPSEIEKHLIKPNDDSIDGFLRKQTDRIKGLSFDELTKKPLLAPQYQEIAFKDLKFNTPTGKIELFSAQARKMWNVYELPEFKEVIERPKEKGEFFLLTPNTKNRIHSQFGNLEVIKQFNNEPTVQINFFDAKELSIKPEQMLEIYNKRGTIRLKAKIDFGIKRGCVSIYNGLWQQEGANPNFLSPARQTDMAYGTAFHDNVVKIRIV